MNREIVRLKAEDYDGLLNLLHDAFNSQPGRTFDILLPAMWERDDEHMSKHMAIKIDGEVAASIGIYPFKTVICGQEVTFATIGNVATAKKFQGMGLMSAIMKEAVEEAKRMGVDCARLGGQRQRYNRFGFENGGWGYKYTLTSKNIKEYFGPLSGESLDEDITFKKITLEDETLMRFCKNLHQSSSMYVDRLNLKRFYKTLSAWKKEIFVAFLEEEPIGYICVSPEKDSVTEHRALNAGTEFKMLCTFVKNMGAESVTIYAAPYEAELNSGLSKICEGCDVVITSHYNVFNWCAVLNPLLKLKATYAKMPAGEFVLEIEGYGKILFKENSCFITEKSADMVLSHLDAVRFLMGHMPPCTAFEVPENVREFVNGAFPLPLWWCDQDRV